LGLTLSWDELVAGLRHPLLLARSAALADHQREQLDAGGGAGLVGRLVALRGTRDESRA